MNLDIRKIKRWLSYTLLVLVISYILTGYGITQWQIVEKITFGSLSKALSFRIHTWLIFPLIIILTAHISLSIKGFRRWIEKHV